MRHQNEDIKNTHGYSTLESKGKIQARDIHFRIFEDTGIEEILQWESEGWKRAGKDDIEGTP